jgi:hypothetical protein
MRSLIYQTFIAILSVGLLGASVPYSHLTRESHSLASSSDDDSDSGDTPVIEYALNQIMKSQRVPTIMSTQCKECAEDSIRNIRYNQCSDSNDYLSSEMNRLKSGRSLLGELIREEPRTRSIIKPQCVRMGMETKFGERSSSFRTCDSEGNMSKAIRPCISDDYFKLINNSFDLVSTCMLDYLSPNDSSREKLQDIRSTYAVINVESGFHINAVSGRGAGGIGQLTADAITNVNNNELSNIREVLSKSPICQRLADTVLDGSSPMNAKKSLSCDRISLENGNPLVNMIYTIANLKSTKTALTRSLFKNRIFSKKFSALSESEKDRLQRSLTMWAHNTGAGGMIKPVMSLLNSVYAGKKVTNVDKFLKQLTSSMASHPHKKNSSSARRRETTGYFDSVMKTLNRVEKNAGEGSCLN